MSSPLIDSLLAAVAANPDDVVLRLHLVRLLIEAGRPTEALEHCTVALRSDPTDAEALDSLARAAGMLTGAAAAPAAAGPTQPGGDAFDWNAAESQVGDIVAPAFVDGDGSAAEAGHIGDEHDVERPGVRLADIAGMDAVKERLELAFLTPMRNPEIGRLYGASMRGGLLLYGPPGCGKTFLARALAGELGARFYAISIADVLDMYIGSSERNMRGIFDVARRNAPCVLFLDEIDALGAKRSTLRNNPAMRGTVNQLLTELDSVGENNEGVYVLAATNAPWDVDAALKRPGRLDRAVLVRPPDAPAREAILRMHLRDRPVAGVELGPLVRATDGWSGADLAGLCDRAAQAALADSVRSGTARPIGQQDLTGVLATLGSSLGPWYEIARNVAEFANTSGEYDDLVAHLKGRRR